MRKENTSYYIQHCLDPAQKWRVGFSAKKRIDFITSADVDWSVVKTYIKNMDYRDFLQTPYWQTIAAHTRYKAHYRCQLCNERDLLVTHHRTYEIHGQEHAHLNDLIVLCNTCHQRFHDGKVARDPAGFGLFWLILACGIGALRFFIARGG